MKGENVGKIFERGVSEKIGRGGGIDFWKECDILFVEEETA